MIKYKLIINDGDVETVRNFRHACKAIDELDKLRKEKKLLSAEILRVEENTVYKWKDMKERIEPFYLAQYDAIIAVDGKMYCAYRKGFINLQESAAGYGETIIDAINDLIKNEVK